MIVTCTSCKADRQFLVSDFLNYIADKSGIDSSNNIDTTFNSLLNWKVVMKQDSSYLNDSLTYAFMSKIICNLIQAEGNPIDILADKGWISNNTRGSKTVDEKQAKEVSDKAIEVINNREFKKTCDYEFVKEPKNMNDDLYVGDIVFDDKTQAFKKVIEKQDGTNEYIEAEFEDVYSYLDIAESFEIDFLQSEVIPLQEEIESSYINNKYNLLASKNHVFESDGFRISYTLSTSGIDIHVSKSVDKVNLYADASIRDVKPSFKWTYHTGDIKNCYFNVSMNTTTSLGASIGKYGNYYLKLKDLDSSSFASYIKSMIVPKNDEVEAIIPICEVKTPVPNIPFASFNMVIGIKLYVSGKVEVILYDSHNIGFEIKDGNSRFFWEHDDDLDTIIRSSAKAALAVNLGLDTASFRLCDLEMDAGLKAEVKSTIHLYDSDFNKQEATSDIEYSTLEELSKENDYIKVCGDVSLHWLLDLILNTSKSYLAKKGFTKTYNILDDNNQVLGNLHHIENGQFVKACTRKTNSAIINNQIAVNSNNKILLNTYAEVLSVGENFSIKVLAMPKGYDASDIRYVSSDNSIVKVENGTIIPLKAGSSKVSVKTSDGKYNTYINVLVSTG